MTSFPGGGPEGEARSDLGLGLELGPDLGPELGRVLGLGIVGAGRFATFLADATADLPGVSVAMVADQNTDRGDALANRHRARSVGSWETLLRDDDVDVVVVATPPGSHALLVRAALEAGKHVFCEKPLATSAAEASALVGPVEQSGRVLVVDHVLRYNPILRALVRLGPSGPSSPDGPRSSAGPSGPGDGLLGRLQRFCFENDASDEDLHPDHWFWDTAQSGGIFVEHGVHFFDAATMLAGTPATSVQASAARRASATDGSAGSVRPVEGPIDLVSATLTHGPGVLAIHTHSFTHAHRCERQLMRLDYGPGEVRVDGWIPTDAVLDLWTGDAGARVAEDLSDRAAELLGVPGFRLGHRAAITTEVHRHAGTRAARGRGAALDLPHHVRVHLTLGGPSAKGEVYAESVRAAMADLVSCVTTGDAPVSGVREGAAAVVVAAAATRAAAEGRTIPISDHDSFARTGTRTA